MLPRRVPQQRENVLPPLGLYLASLLTVALLAFSLQIFGQHHLPREPAVWMPYNTMKEVAVSGDTEDVRQFECPCSGMRLGDHVTLRTSHENIELHLAEAVHLRIHGIRFNNGDRLEVVGSQVEYQGHPAVVAREIVRGSEHFIFRDTAGNPVWTDK